MITGTMRSRGEIVSRSRAAGSRRDRHAVQLVLVGLLIPRCVPAPKSHHRYPRPVRGARHGRGPPEPA